MQGVFAVLQAQVQVNAAHAQAVNLAIQLGEQRLGPVGITVGANPLQFNGLASEVDRDTFISAGAAQADGNGAFYTSPRLMNQDFTCNNITHSEDHIPFLGTSYETRLCIDFEPKACYDISNVNR